MKKGEKKRPTIVRNPFAVLTPKDKEYLRGVLTNPTYLKMMGIIQKFRPSSSCKMAGSRERDQFANERANARLAEMRGWDAYEVAIFAILSDTPLPKAPEEASYPDSGRLDADWGKVPQTK